MSLAIASLISYGFYTYSIALNPELIGLGALIISASTLALVFALKFTYERTTINVRVVGIIFFIAGLFSNFYFFKTPLLGPAYIIVNGLIFLVLLTIIYTITQLKQ